MNTTTFSITVTLSVNLFLASPSTQAAGNLQAQCLGSRGHAAVEVCRSLAASLRDNVPALLGLGRQLDAMRNDAAAAAVYLEGVTLCRSESTCGELQRKELTRLHALAQSNASESVHAARTRGAQSEQSAAVAFKVDEIRCRRLHAAAAVKACEKALRSTAGNPELYEHLGDALRSAGRHADALDAYGQALALAPGRTTAVKKRRELLMESVGGSTVAQSPAVRPTVPPPAAVQTPVVHVSQEAGIADLPETPQTVVEKVRTLLRLHNEGLITSETYEQRKRALLDGAFRPAHEVSVASEASQTIEDLAHEIDFGEFHALVIGNNTYAHFPDLETAVADANAIAATLRDHYGFSTKVLTNAPRYVVVKELSALRASMSESDNLLIYYAGHGVLDELTGRGYWLPVDAEEDNTANWISTADVTDALHGMSARHVLVVADSCYSGTLTRAAAINLKERKALLKRLASKRSRTVLSSGGLEPILDSGRGNHSVFANALLQVLRENRSVMEGSRLFTELRPRVILDADQTPEYADIRKSGHEGGDFILVRRL